MGSRLCTPLLAGPDLHRLWVKTKARAVALGQPAEVLGTTLLLALRVQKFIRPCPVLLDEGLVVSQNALLGAGCRKLFRQLATPKQDAREQPPSPMALHVTLRRLPPDKCRLA